LIVVWALFSLVGQTAWQRRLATVGVSVGNLSVAWKGTLFNRVLVRLVVIYPAALRAWFDLGAVVGAVTLVVAPLLLSYLLWTSVARWFTAAVAAPLGPPVAHADGASGPKSQHGGGTIQLVPMVPGVTVPMAHAVRLLPTTDHES
jgi:hypothetical protein